MTVLNIALGQRWRTRGGDEVTITEHDHSDLILPFAASEPDCWYGPNGHAWGNTGHDKRDLVTLVSELLPEPEVAAVEQSFQAFDAQVKLSNPKDSVGDTKLPLWLLSPIAKAHWALGQFAGMLKYGAWNWRAAGVRGSVYISALERHLEGYKNGETFDPVDGTHHLGNIMACCGILLEAEAIGKLTDDRPPSIEMRKTFEQVQAQMVVLREQYKDKAPKHWTINDEVPA